MPKMLAIVLALALPLAGYANYQRNAHLDRELENRTYATLRTEDLDTLLAAYGEELDALRGRVGEGPEGEDAIARKAAADLSGKVESFERFQRQNQSWREQRGAVLERQATIAELEREKSIRARGLDRPWNRIKRRVLAF
jgi:hypothetical protein